MPLKKMWICSILCFSGVVFTFVPKSCYFFIDQETVQPIPDNRADYESFDDEEEFVKE
jgi:hypothetical protein